MKVHLQSEKHLHKESLWCNKYNALYDEQHRQRFGIIYPFYMFFHFLLSLERI